MESSLLWGHSSNFVELELDFEASIVNLSIFDNYESQFESLRAQFIIVWVIWILMSTFMLSIIQHY